MKITSKTHVLTFQIKSLEKTSVVLNIFSKENLAFVEKIQFGYSSPVSA